MDAVRKLELASVEAYFAYTDAIEGRAEYYDGLIIDMAGGSPEHSNIAANFSADLVYATRGKGCKVYNPDLQIAVGPANSYVYPDVAVVCGELEISDLRKGSVRNPTLVVEVLSPTTAARDRGEKFEIYQHLESLREYVLVEQDLPQVYVFTKSQTGEWVYHCFTGLESMVKLVSLGITIPMANIYYDVVFPVTSQEAEE